MPPIADKPTPTRLADYRPPAWLVDEVELSFDLDEAATRVTSRLRCRRNPARVEPGSALMLDGGPGLKLLSVRLDGRPLRPGDYALGEKGLVLAGLGDAAELETEVLIAPAENSRLEGLYLSNGIFCTQCEAEGFRHITYFPDRPDVMAVYRTTIRADATRYPVLLSNGNPVEAGTLRDGRHFATWHDPFRKPCYLFALVAGNLGHLADRFTTASGREVELRIYVDPGREARAGYAMDALKRAMRWDETRYGLEYDLDRFNIVAVDAFNMGAMENKSLNIFNAKYVLADPDTATDQDFAFIESIVAHEYFHNWTGNRVTCRDWFQLSLKEGLTVFRDQQFSADMRSEAVKRIQEVRQLRSRQFAEDAGPLAHPVRPASYIEINNFYTATVYEKGAELIRMLHRLLGEDGFMAGIRLYFERHDGAAATCDDFVAAMADANRNDLAAFKHWYSQAGTPEVTVATAFDAAARRLTIELRQATPPTPGEPEKRSLPIPLELGLIGSDGSPQPVRFEGETAPGPTSRVLTLASASERYVVEDIAVPPIVSVNRGFTAPIKVVQPLDEVSRALLMAHDTDAFNRFEAGQQFATRLLLDAIAARRDETEAPTPDVFIAALGRTLDDERLDDAFKAEMLGLPGEDFLAQEMPVIDVEAIHGAREALRRRVADRLGEALTRAYHARHDNAPYSPDAVSAGRRALKNRALGYLAVLDGGEGLALLTAQYRNADNMTDRMAALALLNDIAGPARQQALDDFHRRYRNDALVLDKWFALQATSALPDTLARVQELLGHPAFSLANPNRVRALIGALALQNPLAFHAPDGSGYDFLTAQVLTLDRRNPQLAARLLPPLGRWRRFDAGRRGLMRAALQRILEQPDLSPDIYEIASKSLA